MGHGGKRTATPGKRIGRPPKPKIAPVGDKNQAAAIIEALNQPASDKDSYEIKQFRKLDDASVDSSRDLRKWLYDKRDGKAPQTVLNAHAIADSATRERVRSLLAQLLPGLAGKAGR